MTRSEIATFKARDIRSKPCLWCWRIKDSLRNPNSNRLCRYQSHFVGHPTRKVPGVEQNTGALGHGLPICVGTAMAGKMDEADFRVFTLLGDGELAEGSNWEAAMCASHHRLDNLTAIVDYNTLQISGRTRDVCDNSPIDEKFASFGWTVRSVDGHNFEELTAALTDAPVDGPPHSRDCQHHQRQRRQFHGRRCQMASRCAERRRVRTGDRRNRQPPASSGSPIVSAPAPSMFSHDALALLEQLELNKGKANLDTFAETVLSLARENRNVLVVTSDSRGSGKLVPFANELPKQIVEVGIAEQNLVGVSAGLAAAGKIPFAVSPACFLTARSLEQIKNDVCYSDNPVKVIGISSGVSYGALGSTHHSIHDLAVLRAINNIDIVVPADNFETTQAIHAAAAQTRPIYVRFGKAAMYDLPRANDDFAVGKAQHHSRRHGRGLYRDWGNRHSRFAGGGTTEVDRRFGTCHQHAFDQAARHRSRAAISEELPGSRDRRRTHDRWRSG